MTTPYRPREFHPKVRTLADVLDDLIRGRPWPFPFPPPQGLEHRRSGGGIEVSSVDLDAIWQAAKQLEPHLAQYRGRVAQVARKYGPGSSVRDIGIIANAALQEVQRDVFSKGWLS